MQTLIVSGDGVDTDDAANDRAERAAMYLGLDVAERYTSQDGGPVFRYRPSGDHPGQPWTRVYDHVILERLARGDMPELLEIFDEPADMSRYRCDRHDTSYGCVCVRDRMRLAGLLPGCEADRERYGTHPGDGESQARMRDAAYALRVA